MVLQDIDPLFQIFTGTAFLNTIQQLSTREQIEIIHCISWNQNVQSINNPSNLPDHTYFQLPNSLLEN